jgi:hypothetical protein
MLKGTKVFGFSHDFQIQGRIKRNINSSRKVRVSNSTASQLKFEGLTSGVVKIVYFQEGFLSLFLFLYKLSAVLDFGLIIARDVIGIKTG